MGRVEDVLVLQNRLNGRLRLGRLYNTIHTENGRFGRGSVKSILPEKQRNELTRSARCVCSDCFSEVRNDWSFLLELRSPYRKVFASRFKGKRRTHRAWKLNDFHSERLGHEYENIFNALNSETPAPVSHSDT